MAGGRLEAPSLAHLGRHRPARARSPHPDHDRLAHRADGRASARSPSARPIGVTLGVLAAFATRTARRCAGGDARYPDRLPDAAARHAGGGRQRQRQPLVGHPRSGHRHFGHRRAADAHPRQARAAAWTTSRRRGPPAPPGSGIVFQHVLPNIWPTLSVNFALQFGLAVIAEASLSYLGLGAPPPNASWGRLLQEAQGTVYTAPIGAIAPGIALVSLVIGDQPPGRRPARYRRSDAEAPR